MNVLDEITQGQIRTDLPVLASGDTVRVSQKIEEKGKSRLQVFEGLVLARKHGREAGATFTVRKVASGVGVEKVFPLYSPMIDSIEVLRRSRTRRAKLYFIREKATSEVKRAMRRQQTLAPRAAAPDEEEAPIVEAEVSDTPEEAVE